ncbi:MAG: tetratricopeptide repeat protein, partial [Myxococcota bacterium]
MHKQPTPEEEIEIARRVLAAGDHPHAAHHVAMALSEDPSREDWQAMLTAIVAECPDPDALLPLGDAPYHGTVAGRAHVLATSGKLSAGLDLLFQIEDAFPDVGYLAWANRWIRTAPKETPLNVSRLVVVLINRNETTIGRLRLRPSEVAALKRFEPLLDALLDRPESWNNPGLLTAASGLMRRIGRLAQAKRLAQACTPLLEAHYGHVLLGLALRAEGDPKSALEAFDAAAQLSPDDLSIRAEQGRAWWEAGDLERAHTCFQEVLEQSPNDQELHLACDWMAWKRDGEPSGAWIEPNISATPTPDDTRLICTPFIGWLPEPTEALVNVARQLTHTAEEKGTMPELQAVALSTLEPPSARMALALTCTGQAEPMAMTVTVNHIPTNPDPREPTGHVTIPLWRYEDDRPHKALPTPPEEVQKTIAELARAPYYLPRLWERARIAADQLQDHTDDALLGALIHPTTSIPEGVAPFQWIQRTQTAAACVIARLD